MWLGAMPGPLKGFFEQVFRPGFAFQTGSRGFPKKHLKGKSARVVIMPAAIYRWYFGAHRLKNLKRNILGFCSIAPCTKLSLEWCRAFPTPHATAG